MKTRELLYTNEASELIRVLTTYKTLKTAQLYRLFSGKEEAIRTLLSRYVKHERLFFSRDKSLISSSPEINIDIGNMKSFWVLLDFYDRIEYHLLSEYPVRSTFFIDGEQYAVIYVPAGHEQMIMQALANKADSESKKIVIVDTPEQISRLAMENVGGFCTVSDDGDIQYFQKGMQSNE